MCQEGGWEKEREEGGGKRDVKSPYSSWATWKSEAPTGEGTLGFDGSRGTRIRGSEDPVGNHVKGKKGVTVGPNSTMGVKNKKEKTKKRKKTMCW